MPTPCLCPLALFVAPLLTSSSVFAAESLGHHRAHPAFAQDVDAFHAVLAPLWHARPGKARSRNTCAQVGEMETLAGNIRSADAKPLMGTIAVLKKQCRASPDSIDAVFSGVREAFRRLVG